MMELFQKTAIGLIALLVFSPAESYATKADDQAATVERISKELLSYRRNEPVRTAKPQQGRILKPTTSVATLENKAEPLLPLASQVVDVEPLPQKTPAGTIGLGTLAGIEVGMHVSRYAYHEKLGNAPFMNTKGDKLGVEAAYTHPLQNDLFLRGEGRFTYGDVTYSGSGTSKNNDDYLSELRGLIGQDYIFNNVGVTVYGGYAVRNLHNDIRGVTSTGSSGYRRDSHYEYAPLGVTSRIRAGDNARLAANVEYDHFTQGEQDSALGDVNPVLTKLTNEQKEAYFAARASLLYETPTWSAGPWINYWHIKDSTVDCVPGFCGQEPRNETTEVGFKVVRRLN